MNYLVFTERPNFFSDAQSASGCFCIYQNKILFLKRHPKKSQGNTWCIPGGKAEEGEDPLITAIRETEEEAGLKLAASQLEKVGNLYFRIPEADYMFHIYHYRFLTLPTLQLKLDEHTEFKWVTLSEALELTLMFGGIDIIKRYQDFLLKKS